VSVYYNEIDPYCVSWLFNLMLAKLIPVGDVDDRPIQEVTPNDVKGYTQCHFFAGIAGWPYALRLAGWPGGRPIWTGSCPCQPFSVAGKRKGFADDRDLWPAWFRLIRECRPPVVMGEQVASAADWLARVRSNLEEVGYAVGCLPIQAACAGAAQYRDRFWFVADLPQRRGRAFDGEPIACPGREEPVRGLDLHAGDGSLARRDLQRQADAGLQRGGQLGGAGGAEEDPAGAVADEFGARLEGGQGERPDDGPQRPPMQRNGDVSVVRPPLDGWGQGWTEPEFRGRGFSAAVASLPDGTQFIECPDGKWRRLPPPRVHWLGNAIPNRVAQLRAFGNAIVPTAAAEVIRAYMETSI
jgi:DNA (cytosine-5)-methyltransferase 1